MTTRSVLAQYINVTGRYGFIPARIRADRGKETPLTAGAHYWLASAEPRPIRFQQPQPSPFDNIQSSTEEYSTGSPPIESLDDDSDSLSLSTVSFRDCWIYGKSTQNIKIESWWGRLCEGRALFWRVSTVFYKAVR